MGLHANNDPFFDLLIDVRLSETRQRGVVQLDHVLVAVHSGVYSAAQYFGELLTDQQSVRSYLVEGVLDAPNYWLDIQVTFF